MKGLNTKIAAAALAACLSGAAGADDLVSASNDMCEKVKACALAEVAESDMTPEMRQMMEPMLAGMCDQMRQGVNEVPTNHQLYQPAVACMRSMAGLSCAEFRGGEVETPECLKYRELADQAYEES